MYNPSIAIDTTQKGEKLYQFAACNRLWLPKQVVRGGVVESNPAKDTVLGIRVGDQTQEMHPWSIQDGFITSCSGPMSQIYVTVLQKGAAGTVYLCTGSNVGISYGDVDGLSANVSDGAGTQAATFIGPVSDVRNGVFKP